MKNKYSKELALLMEASQKGDKDAYHNLLSQVYILIENFIKQKISDVNIWDDLIQEVLMGMHKARHTYNTDKPFLPWLYAIARYKIIDYLRLKGKEGIIDFNDDVLFSLTSKEEDFSQSFALKDTFYKAVDGLPHKQREAFELVHIKGLPLKKAAEKLGASLTSVKVNAHRAYKKIKDKLGDS